MARKAPKPTDDDAPRSRVFAFSGSRHQEMLLHYRMQLAQLYPTRERISLPTGFRFHDLRHFYASLLIASGEDMKVVQYRLRHASAKTTSTVTPLAGLR